MPLKYLSEGVFLKNMLPANIFRLFNTANKCYCCTSLVRTGWTALVTLFFFLFTEFCGRWTRAWSWRRPRPSRWRWSRPGTWSRSLSFLLPFTAITVTITVSIAVTATVTALWWARPGSRVRSATATSKGKRKSILVLTNVQWQLYF